jgi:hypothetical protein
VELVDQAGVQQVVPYVVAAEHEQVLAGQLLEPGDLGVSVGAADDARRSPSSRLLQRQSIGDDDLLGRGVEPGDFPLDRRPRGVVFHGRPVGPEALERGAAHDESVGCPKPLDVVGREAAVEGERHDAATRAFVVAVEGDQRDDDELAHPESPGIGFVHRQRDTEARRLIASCTTLFSIGLSRLRAKSTRMHAGYRAGTPASTSRHLTKL